MQNLPYGQISLGDSPVLVVTPHTGTSVPAQLLSNPAWAPVQGRLSDPFGALLQSVAAGRGMSCISALYHPCVIDCNVGLDSRPLSPRLNRVGLCRTHTSRGEALYPDGQEPSEAEVRERVDVYWKPFHAAVAEELLRLRRVHDNVLLLVSHASSWLSPYREQLDAADCNIGTNRGIACERRLVTALTKSVQNFNRSWVVNGKLADVFAAQHYGLPASGVHAIELEVAGHWRADCEQWLAAVPPDSEFEGMAAAVGISLDALEATLNKMQASQQPVQADSESQARD